MEPFFLVYGRLPKLPLDQLTEERINTLNDHIEQIVNDLSQIREEARIQINKS